VTELEKVVPKSCKIVPVPSDLGVKGISGKRQFIVDWSFENNFQKVWQIDDTLKFCTNIGPRDDNQGPRLLTSTLDDMRRFFKVIEEKLENYPIVGNLNRAGTYQQRINSKDTYEDFENARIYSSIAVRTDILKENNLRFDYLQVLYKDDSLSLMEDYALLLQTIQAGFKTLQLGSFCFDKESFSGKGGCSDERNLQRQKKICLKMEETFPGLVKAIEAKDKLKSETVGWNVRISWAKLKETKNNEDSSKTPDLSEW